MMTMGYNNNHKAYKLFYIDTNMMSFNRYVVVDE